MGAGLSANGRNGPVASNRYMSRLAGPVTPACPASVLREHPRASVFLDAGAASLLDKAMVQRWRRQ